MESLQEGCEQALGSLLDRHWEPLVAYATAQLGRSDEAEDVVQEVFVRLWEHRNRWEPSGSVRAYLYRIARNLVIGHARHRQVRRRSQPDLVRLAGRVKTPVEDLARVELREAFEEALALLPDRRREAFLLVRLQGLSLREAAEVMAVTRRTVANHVYRAVTDLEESLRVFLA